MLNYQIFYSLASSYIKIPSGKSNFDQFGFCRTFPSLSNMLGLYFINSSLNIAPFRRYFNRSSALLILFFILFNVFVLFVSLLTLLQPAGTLTLPVWVDYEVVAFPGISKFAQLAFAFTLPSESNTLGL